MDKAKFHDLLENFAALNAGEAIELIQLVNKYPYSQVVRNLATKAAKDNQLESADDQVKKSAVYTTDRSVLKRIITKQRIARNKVAKPEPSKLSPTNIPATSTTPTHTPTVQTKSTKTGNALVKELMSDLNKLQKLKKEFQLSVEKFDKAKSENLVAIEKPVSTAKKATLPTKSSVPKEKAIATSKKKVSNVKSATKKKGLKQSTGEALIDEIAKKKKELPLEGPKQKEQHEIIDNFIKTKPNLKKGIKTEGPNMPDLAENSVFYSDQVVSETLVSILIDQGKKEKAIEMLKKLIWKYPQKKAYFAARIEELKN